MHGTALLQQPCCRSHECATARKSQANFPNHQTHSRCCFQWEGTRFWENSEVGHFSSENGDEQPPDSNLSFPTAYRGAVATNVPSPRSTSVWQWQPARGARLSPAAQQSSAVTPRELLSSGRGTQGAPGWPASHRSLGRRQSELPQKTFPATPRTRR